MRFRHVALAAALAATLASPLAAAPSEASRRRLMTEEQIAQARLVVPRDALERRLRSQRRLEAEGVPINPLLPAIEGESEARRRSVEEVAERAIALLVVAGRATGLSRAAADTIIADLGIAGALSPIERKFIADEAPSEQQAMQLSWRYEAAVPLLWALGFIDRLEKPEEPRDTGPLVRLIAGKSRAELLAAARLRPLPQILDEADLIFRYHWAAREAELNEQPVPARLDIDVIMERHTALNWLIGYMDQPWDEVTTDT